MRYAVYLFSLPLYTLHEKYFDMMVRKFMPFALFAGEGAK